MKCICRVRRVYKRYKRRSRDQGAGKGLQAPSLRRSGGTNSIKKNALTMRLPSPNEFFVGPRPIHRSGWSFRCQGFERARRKETNHIRQPSCWTDGRTDITVSYNSCTPTTKGLFFFLSIWDMEHMEYSLHWELWFTQTYALYFVCMYIHHSWKSRRILATGCRRWGAENDARQQKRRKIAKTSPKSKEKLA